MAVPVPSTLPSIKANFEISQYRHEEFDSNFAHDAMSFVAYPIMESFESSTNVAGVLVTNFYWRLIFVEIFARVCWIFYLYLGKFVQRKILLSCGWPRCCTVRGR